MNSLAINRMRDEDGELECDAGIHGGCGACEKCDPEWWDALKRKEDGNG